MDLYTYPKNPWSFSGLSGFVKNNPKVSTSEKKDSETLQIHRQTKKRFSSKKNHSYTLGRMLAN